MKETTGTLEKQTYKHGAIKLNDQELVEYVQANPDLYQKDYAEKLNMSSSGICRAFKRLHITVKVYKERNEERRDAYKQEIAPVEERRYCLHR